MEDIRFILVVVAVVLLIGLGIKIPVLGGIMLGAFIVLVFVGGK